MPLRDVAAQNRSLDNDYGTIRGPHAADSHQLALFFGDPLEDGVELNGTDCPGYARATVLPADWLAAADGAKTATVTFPDTTGEWTIAATHWGLFGDDDAWWDCNELAEPLEVTGASNGPVVDVTVQYDTSLGLDL